MVLTWIIQHLHKKTKLNHIRVIKLLEDGYLLVNTLQRAFGLRRALRGQFCPTRRRSTLTREPSLPHQAFLGQHFHGLWRVVRMSE
uniref:Uncharacterized protein n=1 Tax=Cyprinus carpio carpio TaxID=630221 RepID=A0A9J8BKR7_CYPCA